MKQELINQTKEAFRRNFESEPEHIFLSPGRINIIGEHVDYNDGFVLPAAIDRYICFAIQKNEKASIFNIIAEDFNDSFSFDVNHDLKGEWPDWAAYILGIIDEIKKSGKAIGGIDIVFKGNIPMGAGLSSSAALECGIGTVLNTVFNLNLSQKEIALIGQRAENNFVGVNCGIMDQFSSVFGIEDKVMMIDCNSLNHEYYDAKIEGYSLILFDSGVKHSHISSGYNDRRADMEKGKKITKNHFPEITSFRECTIEMLQQVREELGEIVFKRCLYVIEEIDRVKKAAEALKNQDLKQLGNLLTQTHHGLSKQYEVSCPEIDFLVDEVLKQTGAIGSRMMGGGFGGCSINLIENGKEDEIIGIMTSKYKEAYNLPLKVYKVNISDGTKEYHEISFNQKDHPHRRYNPLLDEWVLVSPQRAKRPWQGQKEKEVEEVKQSYDPDCYLCSGNIRINGIKNPEYKGAYVFDNDFGALLKESVTFIKNDHELFKIQPERGINRVVCFSEDHSLTLPEMNLKDIVKVIDVWQEEYQHLGKLEYINHVQIFENKGAMMGCSNPHPHGQIWAQSSIPSQVLKTQKNLLTYFQKNRKTLLEDYLFNEIELGERIILENDAFIVVVPFWATWPYETMIISKRKITNITEFTIDEKKLFAKTLKELTTKYDNIFESSFPYSAGIHQAPTDGELHEEWHFHMHFYPPLLRSAHVKKFMVGYEMLAEAQRDITPEQSAEILKNLSTIHYKHKYE
ncbi:UDP-glucose--hexose-1-phosphate uridylyltransferase [Chryseobacterium sp.]|uniref:UDP-glucose--hexose-1-phosphate uridylyltransferase n=1 Tax=Chryseobacterium sp. TaxID=1871047 RepID=UPI00289B0C6E|nr:UDP-glucose--hexose-1-phosphate uridylyltransferase [Chryseobacterium sp.]